MRRLLLTLLLVACDGGSAARSQPQPVESYDVGGGILSVWEDDRRGVTCYVFRFVTYHEAAISCLQTHRPGKP